MASVDATLPPPDRPAGRALRAGGAAGLAFGATLGRLERDRADDTDRAGPNAAGADIGRADSARSDAAARRTRAAAQGRPAALRADLQEAQRQKSAPEGVAAATEAASGSVAPQAARDSSDNDVSAADEGGRPDVRDAGPAAGPGVLAAAIGDLVTLMGRPRQTPDAASVEASGPASPEAGDTGGEGRAARADRLGQRLLAFLDRIEQGQTGVDPKAPPEGWVEPEPFKSIRNKIEAGVAALKEAATRAQGDAHDQAQEAGASAATALDGALERIARRLQDRAERLLAEEGAAPPSDDYAGAARRRLAEALETGAFRAAKLAAPAKSTADARPGSGQDGEAGKTSPPPAQALFAERAATDPARVQAKAMAADPTTPEPTPAGAHRQPSSEAAPLLTPARAGSAASIPAAAAGPDASPAPGLASQISAQISRKAQAGSSQFDMQLHPADLGRVDVRLSIDRDGRLAATLAFDNPAAAADLRGRADELRRSLEQAGFSLGEGSLSFFDRGADPGNGRDPSQGERQPSRSVLSFASAEARADAPPTPARAAARPLGLDLRV